MNSHTDRAKQLLKHYFTLVMSKTGNTFDSDCYSEIEDIVDEIISAVKQDLRQEKEDENAGSYGEYKHRYNKTDYDGEGTA